jgi:hypothetical protein
MYGFVNFALEQLVIRNFGEEIWTKIKYGIQGFKKLNFENKKIVQIVKFITLKIYI